MNQGLGFQGPRDLQERRPRRPKPCSSVRAPPGADSAEAATWEPSLLVKAATYMYII